MQLPRGGSSATSVQNFRRWTAGEPSHCPHTCEWILARLAQPCATIASVVVVAEIIACTLVQQGSFLQPGQWSQLLTTVQLICQDHAVFNKSWCACEPVSNADGAIAEAKHRAGSDAEHRDVNLIRSRGDGHRRVLLENVASRRTNLFLTGRFYAVFDPCRFCGRVNMSSQRAGVWLVLYW